MMRSERRLWRLSDKSPEHMISHTRQSIQMQIREEWFKLEVKMGIVAVCISEKKGTAKQNVGVLAGS